MHLPLRRSVTSLALGLLLLAVFLLVVLVSPGPFASLVQPVRNLLVDGVTSAVSLAFNGRLTIGELTGSLLSAPRLRHLELRDATGASVLTIEEVRLEYDLTDVFAGRIHVQLVEIFDPWARLEQDEDGRLNIVAIFSSGNTRSADLSSGLPVAIAFDEVVLRDGHAELSLTALPGVREVTGLSATLRGDLRQAAYRLELDRLQGHALPADVSVLDLRGAVSLADGSLRLDDWLLVTDRSRITLGGIAPGGPNPADLHLILDPFDVADIGRLTGNDALHGPLKGRVTAIGPPRSVVIDGVIDVPKGSLRIDARADLTPDVPAFDAELRLEAFDPASLYHRSAFEGELNANLRASAGADAGGGRRSELHLEIGKSRLGRIDIEPSRVRFDTGSAGLRVQEFDLRTSVADATVQGGIARSGDAGLQYTVTARADGLQPYLAQPVGGTLQLQGGADGHWPDVSSRGRLTARDLVLGDRAIGALRLNYGLTGIVAGPALQILVEATDGRIGAYDIDSLRVEANWRQDDAGGQGRFDVALKQSDRVDAQVAGDLRSDEKRHALTVDHMVANLNARHWSATGPLKIGFGPGTVSIAPFRLEHGEETVSLSGGFRDGRITPLSLAMQRIDLDALRHALALPAWVSGRMNLAARAEGAFDDPELRAEIELSHAPAESPPFERTAATLTYSDHRVTGSASMTQQARTAAALEIDLPIDAAIASLPLERRLKEGPVSLQLDLDRPDLAALSRTFTGLQALDGTMSGRTVVEGDWTAASFRSDLEFQGMGFSGMLDELRSSLRLRADIRTAEDLNAFRDAIATGTAGIALHDLVLETPSMTASLPGNGTEDELSISDLSVSGAAEIHPGRIAASVDRFQARAEMTGYPATDVALTGELGNGHVTVGSLSVRAGDSAVTGRGSLTLADGRVDAAMDIPNLELRDFISALPGTLPSRLSGTVGLKGGTRTADLTASLVYAGGTVESRVRADLRATEPSYSLDARVSGVDLARFLSGERGRANASLELGGSGFSASARDLHLTLNVDATGFSAIPGLTGSLRAALKRETLDIESLDIKSEPAVVNARGVVSLSGPSDLRYGVELRDASPFGGLAGRDVGGRGLLTGSIRGTPEALQMTSGLNLAEWRYSGWSGGALDVQASIDDPMDSPRLRLEGNATGLTGPGIEIGDLTVETDYADHAGGLAVEVIEGALSGSRIAGRVRTAAPAGATVDLLELQHGDYIWRNAAPVEIGFEGNGGFRLARAKLTNGVQRIEAGGERTPGGKIKGQFEIVRLDVGDLGASLVPSLAGLDGTVDASASLNGTASRPVLDGTIEAAGMQWEQRALGELHAALRSDGPVYRGEARWTQSGAPLMSIDGSVDVTGDGALSVRTKADEFDLAILRVLGRQIQESAGVVDLDLTLGGTMKDPSVEGTLVLRDGVLRLRSLGARYEDIEARIKARDKRVEIEKFSLSSGAGEATLGGWASLRGSGPTSAAIDLSLETRDFTLLSTAAFSAVVTSNLKARGSQQDLAVTGESRVSRGRFGYQNLPSSGASKVEPWELTVEGVYGPGKAAVVSDASEANGAARHDAPPLPFLRTDIGIDFPRNVWVQGDGTAVELGGKVRVGKDLDGPFIVSGEIDTLRGFATFLGKKFTVEKGHVTLTGTEEIQPLYDVVAMHRVSDYNVYVDVRSIRDRDTGKMRPEISFRSEPELDESDVLSLLMFGKTSDRLTSSEQSSLSSQAQSVAGGVASSLLERSLGSAIGLDSIAIDLGDSDTAGSVGVGQYLSQDVYMSYERVFRNPQNRNKGGNAVGIEYAIGRGLKIKGTGSDYGESAIDFFYEHDY
ncbi:MAG: translocation/assembly module TamB domain-containing protein [Gammaproteobacteria bacterium]|nr:translocation/assembly module TamB domain-containing protein [Gammaproteobacteria bacterium]